MLAKTKLKSIDVLISRALIGSYISQNDFVSVKNVLNESHDMKKNNWKSKIFNNLSIFLSILKIKVKTEGLQRQIK